ncbi:hypothetical protein ACHAWU_007587 [Discostella pseudostelligera]|uniref:Uncharacterized protein n=1 Tax=Discostella pseudostelligera TaxID=259834 RepID=A0ABD3M7D0_9STRA
MQHQSQQMQALEEQKLRYSLQLQQLQQKKLQTQDQGNGQHQYGQPQQQQQQQQQLYPTNDATAKSSQQADRRLSLGVGTQAPSSPTNTTSQGPSPRPNSQFPIVSTQPVISSHNNSTEFPFPYNSFYHPLSTSAKNKRQKSPLDRRDSASTASVQHNIATDMNAGAYARPSFPQNVESNVSLPLPSKQQETTPSSAGKSVGKKSPPQRRQSQTQPTSSLKYEEIASLVNECTTEQKIIWVARQVIGAGGSHGFQKSTSALQRIKRQRARSCKQKEGAGLSKDLVEENLKIETFDARVAKRMYAEMKQGLQYCNLMTNVVRTILEDIDPENPILLVKPPVIGFDAAARGADSEHPFPVVENGTYDSSVARHLK